MNRRIQSLSLLLLPISLIGIYFCGRPYSTELVQINVDTSHLTTAQKFNIERAAKKINGFILKPGQQFSFNGAVGPRTPAAGYLDAPTYVENGSASTAGGGICVVSSAIYQAALLADLPVKERTAHMKVMQTVKPGLDATVWYGGADLKFDNKFDKPVEIDCVTNQATESLTVKFMSERKFAESVELTTSEVAGSNNTLAVEVYSRSKSASRLISRDLYRTSFEATADGKAHNTRH